MDYEHFIQLRSGVWERFEERLNQARDRASEVGHDELEELALLYRQVLHDLSLATSRYPATGVTRRLGHLAAAGTHWLRRDRVRRRRGLIHFLSVSFPRAFRRLQALLALNVALFCLAALFGLALASTRPGIERVLLPYESIRGLTRGQLWTESLTTTIPPAVSSSTIATNNMSVALTAWAGGALAGFGALWVVLLNGAQLGAVLGVTLRYSMAGELLEFVAAHGPLEITLILVTAAAGLGMGRAMVVAGERPRGEAMRQAARDAMIVLLGCLPWFLILGLVEGFISPQPELETGVKLLLGLALEALFLILAWRPGLKVEGRSHA